MAKQMVPYPKAVEQYPTLRQSMLSAFDLCALEAHFDLLYTRGWATHPQARGRVFHHVAARAMTEMNRQNEETIEVDVALAILHEVLRQDDLDRCCPECGNVNFGPVQEGFRVCADGHRFETEIVNVPLHSVKDLYWVVKKWAHDNSFDIKDLVAVEQRMSAKIEYPNPDGGTVERVITGALDALLVEGVDDDHAIVLDWKDTWGLPAPAEVSFEGYFQQRFYAFLVMENYRTIEKVTLREFYVRYSEPREATLYRHQLDDVRAELSALVERFDRAVESKTFVPTPGKHCSYCPRPTSCPIPKHVRGAGKIESQEDAERSARRLIVAKAIIGQETDALNEWALLHGPIPMRDAKGVRVYGHRPVTRVERPTRDQLEQAIREAGTTDSLNLDSLFVEKQGTRFEAHVPKPTVESDTDAQMIAKLQEAVADARARRNAA